MYGRIGHILIALVAILLVAAVVYAIPPRKADVPATSGGTYSSTNELSHMDTKTIEGLGIEVLREGAGASAENGQLVSVQYTGTLTNGTVFDSSIPRGEPFQFRLGAGQVIKGWDLGVLGMKIGEKRRLTISPELGYGKEGFPGVIPENATLIFEVELVSVR